MSHLVLSMPAASVKKGTVINTIISNICQKKTYQFFRRNKTFLHTVKLNKSNSLCQPNPLEMFKKKIETILSAPFYNNLPLTFTVLNKTVL